MTLAVSSSAPQIANTRTSQNTPPAKKTLVDQVVDKTVLSANFLGSAVGGGVGAVGGYGSSIVGTTLNAGKAAYTNLWKAETIGPNLKIIGTVAVLPLAVAGAALALPISAAVGMFEGAREVDSSKPREFTISQGTAAGFNDIRSGVKKAGEGLVESLNEFGAEKLGEGEKPLDIPIIKTAKTLAVGAAAIAVGGIAGVVSAVVGVARETVSGVVNAFKDDNLNIAGKAIAGVGAVIGGTVHGVAYGLANGISIAGSGFSETWKKDSVVAGSKKVLGQAASAVAAAATPKSTLLQEKPEAQA